MKMRAPARCMRQNMSSLSRAHPVSRVAARATPSSRARITARASSSSSPSSDSPYDALGVARGASREAVKRAYKRMAKLYHPDVCDDAEDSARFLRAKAAYEVLVHATTGDLEDVKTEAWKSVAGTVGASGARGGGGETRGRGGGGGGGDGDPGGDAGDASTSGGTARGIARSGTAAKERDEAQGSELGGTVREGGCRLRLEP